MSLFLVTHGNIHLLCNVCYVYCHHQMVHPSPFFFFPFFLTSYWVSVFFFFFLPYQTNADGGSVCVSVCFVCVSLSSSSLAAALRSRSRLWDRWEVNKVWDRSESQSDSLTAAVNTWVISSADQTHTHTHRVTTYTVSQRLYYIYIFIYPAFQDNCDTL